MGLKARMKSKVEKVSPLKIPLLMEKVEVNHLLVATAGDSFE